MKTNTNCIRVIFNNACSECGTVMRADINEEGEFFVALDEVLINGNPICECGIEIDNTGKVEVLA